MRPSVEIFQIFDKMKDRFYILTDNKRTVRALNNTLIYIAACEVLNIKMSTICQLQFSVYMGRINYLCKNNLQIYEKEL